MTKAAPQVKSFDLQALETRVVFAASFPGSDPVVSIAEPWGANANLIRQDIAVLNHAQFDGAGQTIAIIDTGIDYLHPSLGGGFGPGFKVVGGYDFFDDDPDPLDISGHGTSVAGVAAAIPFVFDNHHYSGIAPAAKLVALRITDSAANPADNDLIERSFQWVIDHREEFGITVVNLSFGFGHFAQSKDDGQFSDEIEQLAEEGVTVVSSSGNGGISDGPGIEYPAADPNVIAAGAVNSFDVISDFTERGEKLDMLAPGEDVTTTTILGDYVIENGTSFASPAIAGSAALLRQVNPDLTPKETLSILRASGVDNTDGDEEFATVTHLHFPRLDVENALSLAQERLAPTEPPLNPVGAFGNGNSVVYDREGILHFAWFDSRARLMRYATRDLSGVWSAAQIVDDGGDETGQFISMALDRNGKPGIAFFDGSQGDLKYASLVGDTWTIETLDFKKSTGLYPSIAFDSENHPLIAYYRKTSGDLRLAQFDGFDWKLKSIDTGDDVGRSASLAMDDSGRVAIAYENSTTGALKFASLASGSADWQIETADPNTHGVAFISLKFDHDRRPNISYYDASPSNLKYALFRHSAWQRDTIESKGTLGLYTQLIVPAEGGDVRVLYYNRTANDLMLATGHPDNWKITQLQTSGGKYASAAVSPDGSAITYASFDTSDGGLLVEETASS